MVVCVCVCVWGGGGGGGGGGGTNYLIFSLFHYRTEVSFSVQNDVLNFETVSQLISQRRGPLSLLNFTVLNISQGE